MHIAVRDKGSHKGTRLILDYKRSRAPNEKFINVSRLKFSFLCSTIKLAIKIEGNLIIS